MREKNKIMFLISNFHRVVNVIFFLLGDYQASEFSVPTFRNTPSVPKRRHRKFRCLVIVQKKEYNNKLMFMRNKHISICLTPTLSKTIVFFFIIIPLCSAICVTKNQMVQEIEMAIIKLEPFQS